MVLYAGNFMPWAQCVETIESMIGWPKDVVLVMHTWNQKSLESQYFEKMQKAALPYEVYFSSDFFTYDDLATALSSADLGLLFYEDIDQNFNEIVFSSNKMAEYISAGLPVICSPFPSLQSFVSMTGVGQSSSFHDLGKTIEHIRDNYSSHKSNVIKCYDKYFNFEKYFNAAFGHLNKQIKVERK